MTEQQLAAMRQALEALQKIYIAPEHEEYIRVWWPACEEAITALRTAIEQAKTAHLQEPVACMVSNEYGVMVWPISDYNEASTYCDEGEFPVKLYTTPPAAQEEIQRLTALVRAQQITIDKLEAKPAPAQEENLYDLAKQADNGGQP